MQAAASSLCSLRHSVHLIRAIVTPHVNWTALVYSFLECFPERPRWSLKRARLGRPAPSCAPGRRLDEWSAPTAILAALQSAANLEQFAARRRVVDQARRQERD